MLTTHLNLVPTLRIRGAILPLPPYVFMAWYLVKHRDNFTFTLRIILGSFFCECHRPQYTGSCLRLRELGEAGDLGIVISYLNLFYHHSRRSAEEKLEALVTAGYLSSASHGHWR